MSSGCELRRCLDVSVVCIGEWFSVFTGEVLKSRILMFSYVLTIIEGMFLMVVMRIMSLVLMLSVLMEIMVMVMMVVVVIVRMVMMLLVLTVKAAEELRGVVVRVWMVMNVNVFTCVGGDALWLLWAKVRMNLIRFYFTYTHQTLPTPPNV